MKLEQDVADHVLRALAGKLLEGRALGELTRRLDSQEEFLAWLLVTEDALAPATELCAQVREIAGNRGEVVVSLLAPNGYRSPLTDARVLFTQPILTRPGQQRVVLAIPVTQLANQMRQEAATVRIEHVYDF